MSPFFSKPANNTTSISTTSNSTPSVASTPTTSNININTNTSGVSSGSSGGGGCSSSQFRLDEVLEEEDEEIIFDVPKSAQQEEPKSEIFGLDQEETVSGGTGLDCEPAPGNSTSGQKSPATLRRKRGRRRSSSDSNGSLAVQYAQSQSQPGAVGSSMASTGLSGRTRPVSSTMALADWGGSWHGTNGGRALGRGWGVPEHHDLQAFVRW